MRSEQNRTGLGGAKKCTAENRSQMCKSIKYKTKEGEEINMKISEILIIIVNISILILPLIMLIENLIKRKYKILNICMIVNMIIWVYLSYIWNVKNTGFWVKCDVRILTLVASILLIASIITFILQIKNKKSNKILIMIAILFVYYIIMTNDTSYTERMRVDNLSKELVREYLLEQHVPYLAFLSIEIELFINLLNSHKTFKEMAKENKIDKNISSNLSN